MRPSGRVIGLAAMTVALLACPPRGLDAPPEGPPPEPAAPPAPSGAAASAPARRAATPSSAPAAADGTDLVAVPPWIDLDDAQDHAWLDGMRRALRAVAPQAATCREGAAADVPGCLCKVICTVKFPRRKQREGSMEVSYPALPRGGPSLRSFRLRADGSVESCTFRGGDPSQPGSRTTEILWCAEEAGGGKPK